MVSDKFVLIANPVSGGGRGRERAEALLAALRSHGKSAELVYTNAPGHAETLAEEALQQATKTTSKNAALRLVACGGDGTIQQICNALARYRQEDAEEGRAILGLAPSGRGNDFGRALGISADPENILRHLLSGETRKVDLGCVNGRYFCTIATLGIDAEISRFVDTMAMPLKGGPAYVYGALRVMLWYRARTMRITKGGEPKPETGDFYIASVANTACYGGGMEIAPGACPDDGELNLCLIDPLSRWGAVTMMISAIRKTVASRSEVRMQTTRRVTIAPEIVSEVWADGERVATTPAEFTIVPDALEVCLARKPATSCD